MKKNVGTRTVFAVAAPGTMPRKRVGGVKEIKRLW